MTDEEASDASSSNGRTPDFGSGDVGSIPADAATDLMRTFDAREWARVFVAIVTANPSIAIDAETMTTWFASALMKGFDEGRWQWQPIATAPKNGTWILVWDGFDIMQAQFIAEPYGWHTRLLCAEEPLYWMPLPQTPMSVAEHE